MLVLQRDVGEEIVVRDTEKNNKVIMRIVANDVKFGKMWLAFEAGKTIIINRREIDDEKYPETKELNRGN